MRNIICSAIFGLGTLLPSLSQAAEPESKALIVRAELCQPLLTLEKLTQEIIDGVSVDKRNALVMATNAMLSEYSLHLPEEIDPAFKSDVVFRALAGTVGQTVWSGERKRIRKKLKEFVSATSPKERLNLANLTVLKISAAVEHSKDNGADMGLTESEYGLLADLAPEKYVELRNWLFLQLEAKGPYAKNVDSRLDFWHALGRSFKRGSYPKKTTLDYKYDFDGRTREHYDEALKRPAIPEKDLATQYNHEFFSAFEQFVGGLKKGSADVFVALHWREFTHYEVTRILEALKKSNGNPDTIELLTARHKELMQIKEDNEFFKELESAVQRRSKELPPLTLISDYTAGRISEYNLKLFGRDMSSDELNWLIKYSPYRFNAFKQFLPEDLVAELLQRREDLEKIDEAWRRLVALENEKPDLDKVETRESYIERRRLETKNAVEKLEKRRAELVKMLELPPAKRKKSAEEIREELFNANSAIRGSETYERLNSLLDAYRTVFNPYLSHLEASAMIELYPLAIRKLLRISSLSHYSWPAVLEVFHQNATASGISESDGKTLVRALEHFFDSEVRPTYHKDAVIGYDYVRKELEPWFERSWSYRGKSLEKELRDQIEEIDKRITTLGKEAKDAETEPTAYEKNLEVYSKEKPKLQKEIDELEAKLGHYFSPKRPK